MSPSGKTLLVIPTYNEAGNLERLLQQIPSAELGVDLLVIDDHSPDGTGAIAERLAARMPLTVMHRPGKLGIGSAHKDGFRHALEHGYARVMTMDADFSHDPRYLPMMLAESSRADVVVGSRYLQGGGLCGWPLWRRLVTHTAHWMTTHVLGLPYDCTGGLRVYRVPALKTLDFEAIKADGYAFLIEMLFHLRQRGCTVHEVPIVINSRHQGASKISRAEIAKAVFLLFRLRFQRVRPAPAGRGGPATPLAPKDAASQWDAYWRRAQGKQPHGLYERMAAFYRRQIISRAADRVLRRYFRNEPGCHYLHAGCGSGGSDQRLRLDQPLFHQLDVSVVALQLHRARVMPLRRQFLCGDLLSLPYGAQTFEGIFNFGVMEHFEEPVIERVLAEFHRVLKPNGYVVLFWPPNFGLSVMVLSGFLRLVNLFRRRPLVLYPPEVSRVKSLKWVHDLMVHNRFRVVKTFFGWRDLFTFVTVVAQKA